MKNITPCLWFDGQAEEAARFYVSVFENAKIRDITHYGEGAPMPAGTVLTVEFELNGRTFVALNGGPQFTFNEAVSFQVGCENQEEVDAYWEKLSAGGEKGPCGWLKDRYGVSWQIVPTILPELIRDADPEKAQRVMDAMLGMTKLDIAALRNAYDAPQGGS